MAEQGMLRGARAAARALWLLAVVCPPAVTAQDATRAARPRLKHVGLNSVDPERAIDRYLRLWPSATRTTVNGESGVRADKHLLFHLVATPPAGVRFLEGPHAFDALRACMIEGPDRLANELIADR